MQKWLSGVIFGYEDHLDVRFLEPFSNQLESLPVAHHGVVKSWCVYKNDARSISFVVENTRSLDIFGNEAKAISRPPPLLAGECIDDLFNTLSYVASLNQEDALDSSHFPFHP